MNENYAKICRNGSLQAGLQHVPLVQFFRKFSQYCFETSIIQIHQRKVKHIFYDKNSVDKLIQKSIIIACQLLITCSLVSDTPDCQKYESFLRKKNNTTDRNVKKGPKKFVFDCNETKPNFFSRLFCTKCHQQKYSKL